MVKQRSPDHPNRNGDRPLKTDMLCLDVRLAEVEGVEAGQVEGEEDKATAGGEVWLADDVTETGDGEEGAKEGEDEAVVPEEGVYADRDEGAEDGACGRAGGRAGE